MTAVIRPAVALTAMLLAAAAPLPTPQTIVGIWYEEAKYPDGHFVISIADIRADGSYVATFRHCLELGHSDTVQRGHWSYANGFMHITKELSGVAYASEDYKTTSFDGHVWEYDFVSGSGTTGANGPGHFRDTRVAAGGRMPDCGATS